MVVKFRNTICPSSPQLSLHRRAALSSNSNGTRSVYSRKNPKSSLYCEISMVETVKDSYSICSQTKLTPARGGGPGGLTLGQLRLLVCSILYNILGWVNCRHRIKVRWRSLYFVKKMGQVATKVLGSTDISWKGHDLRGSISY
jgi:hypothetical protein